MTVNEKLESIVSDITSKMSPQGARLFTFLVGYYRNHNFQTVVNIRLSDVLDALGIDANNESLQEMVYEVISLGPCFRLETDTDVFVFKGPILKISVDLEEGIFSVTFAEKFLDYLRMCS